MDFRETLSGKILRSDLRQEGQALLISLLVLSVATTVVLALIGRTTTTVAITAQSEESAKALAAAEAGMEQALKAGTSVNGSYSVSGSAYSYTVNQLVIGGGTGVYTFPSKTPKGTTEILWLSPHNSLGILDESGSNDYNQGLSICWSSESTVPAIVVSLLYKTVAGSYGISREAYDFTASTRGNSFSSVAVPGPNCNNSTNYYKQVITLKSDPDINLALRIRPLYNDTQIAIQTGGLLMSLPAQGYRYESTGTFESGTTRKVLVNQFFRGPDTIFDYVLYSQTGSLAP